MDDLESKIAEILRRGTPLRAAEIARVLGVERREVNHYLYSSLRYQVSQGNDYRWSLKTNQVSFRKNNHYHSTNLRSSQTQSSRPVGQSNPYEVLKKELNQVPPEEKIKILENVFRQDQFMELEDEQISALSSVLEQAKREVGIANQAYTQGKLSSQKNYPWVIAMVSVALALSALLVMSQLRLNSIDQPSPTIQQNQ